MQKLHLVGFTTDQDGLILSARKSARSGGYLLQVDDSLAGAVEAYRARQEEAGVSAGHRADRVESRLPVSEIQLRLRRGKSLKDVAKEAGVDPEWVERFAAPVFAEQNQVIDHVRSSSLRRARLGPSALRIGDALRRNLAERGVVLSPDEFTEGWTTRQMPDGKWTVRFKVRYRGSDRTLRFDLAKLGGEVVAYDQLTKQMAYITPPPRKTTVERPKPVVVDDDAAVPKRAVVSTGFRPEPDRPKPVSRPAKEREKAAKAMNKAAIRRASEAEKAAARKGRERELLLARREREAAAEAARREKEAAARARAAAAAARAAAAEVARQERADRAAAAQRQAERDKAREAARTKAIKAVRARPTTKKAAPAKKAPAKAADKARTAAAVRQRGAEAEAASRTRATKARTPSTTTVAKRAAAKAAPAKATPAKAKAAPAKVAPAKAAPAKVAPRKAVPTKVAPAKAVTQATPPPAKSPVATAKRPAQATPRARPAVDPVRTVAEAPAAAPASVVSEPRPLPSARVDPARLVGTAVEAYGPEGTRALFRAGLVEPAAPDGTGGDGPVRTTSNGNARPSVRPMGRRRRRQLRAD